MGSSWMGRWGGRRSGAFALRTPKALAFADAIMPRQIAMAAYASIAGLDKRRGHRCTLVRAMLEHQPPAGGEVRAGVANQVVQSLETGVARRQCRTRLMAKRSERRVVHADVGGVADDEFELAARERREPVAGQKLQLQKAESPGVGAGDLQGRDGQIGGG